MGKHSMIPDSLVWQPRPKEVLLARDEVHVWRADLSQAEPFIDGFLRQLSADEQARAARFHFERDRRHFIFARGLLRTLLGGYLGLAPSQIRFRYNDYGKPELAEGLSETALSFNLSHSHELVLYAFADERALGLDVEHMHDDFASREIAERFFSRSEVEALQALPIHLRTRGFFNCWTRKEAFIKAKGAGLSIPLDRFAVSLAPDERALLLSVTDEPEEVARWSLKELNVGPDYAAALMGEGHDWRLTCWQWQSEAPPAELVNDLRQTNTHEPRLKPLQKK